MGDEPDGSRRGVNTQIPQNLGLVARGYDITSGLKDGVNDALCDEQNNLWLAAGSGLVRFDGIDFHYRTEGLPGFPDSVRCLYMTRDGYLWFGTGRNGVFRLKEDTIDQFARKEGLPGLTVFSITMDRRGGIWLGTNAGICTQKDDRFEVPEALSSLNDTQVRCIVCDGENRLWIGTTTGVAVYQHGRLTRITERTGPPEIQIWDICEDSQGRVWFATDGAGPWCHEKGKFTGLTPLDGPFAFDMRVIFEDQLGRIWFGSDGDGLTCWDGTKHQTFTTRHGLLQDRINCITQDRSGHLWIGHTLAGLTQFDLTNMHVLSERSVTEVLYCDSSGRTWIASDECICCIDLGCQRARRFGGRVMDILEDESGAFWVATRSEGLFRFHSPSAVWQSTQHRLTMRDGFPTNHITSLYQAADKTIWVGTQWPGSICRLEDGKVTEVIKCPHPTVSRLLADSKGRLWLGGFEGGGLSCFADGKLVTYTRNDGLPDEHIQSLVEAEDGCIWIGTQQGVCRFDGKVFYHFAQEAELESLFHQCSARDVNGVLWFGTLRGGLYRTDGKHFQALSTEDGLPSNSVTGLVPLPDGAMLIGTYRGVARYRTSQPTPPAIEVIEIIADEVYDHPTELTFTTGRMPTLTVSYRGSSLATKRMRYRYTLKGHDSDWHETWDETIRYEGLGPGEYTFMVTAINRDLVCSESPAIVRLTIVADEASERLAAYQAKIGQMERLLEHHQQVSRLNQALIALANRPIAAEGHLTDVLEEAGRVAVSALNARRCCIWLREDDYSHTVCNASESVTINESDSWTDNQNLQTTFFATCLEELELHRAFAIEDVTSHPLTQAFASQLFTPVEVHSLLLAPVRMPREAKGVVCVGDAAVRAAWTPEEQHFLSSLADHISLSVENVQRRSLEEALIHSQEQLLQSQKMEAIGTLAGGIAHDFNNLLTAIIGCVEFLLEDMPATEGSRETLLEIHTAADRASSLTRQLLAFSRKQVIHPQILDLNRVVSEMENMLRRLIGESVELHTHAGEALPAMKADAGQVELVLMNLVVNARDAMPNGGTLTIRTASANLSEEQAAAERGVKAGSYITLTVSDTGQGMDEKTLGHIYEPFFTTKQEGRGTGLGLATVYGIVQQNNGFIRVKSKPEEGTEFTVAFPSADSAGLPKRQVQTKLPNLDGSETVMVVEDEEIVRDLVCLMLRSHGYKVLSAPDPRSALNMLQNGVADTIDLLITDIVMPKMSGLELAQQVLEMKPGLPVVYMSGHTDDDSVHTMMRSDESMFLPKPFHREVLLTKVREALRVD